MNIQIRPGAATEDARQIDHIIEQITENMATLNDAIKKNIPAGINTEWSDRVRSDWEKYYNESIPATMQDMHASAVNLRLAVEQALAYSKEK